MAHSKTSYACLPCRASHKQRYGSDRRRICPQCSEHMVHVGAGPAMTAYGSLTRLVTPPAAPVDARGDWAAAGTALGVRLPEPSSCDRRPVRG
ncbi:hypothetical protein [Streptomyces sp. NPDC086835]|uniref:hypothetical protein n=1 Tax=Streptomyces sp. NPDC086835 TaxID=3365761 RepID=UPI0038231C17